MVKFQLNYLFNGEKNVYDNTGGDYIYVVHAMS